jgi:hypothetical protein
VSESVPPPESSSAGTPGASARREHQRRKTNREQQVRTAHPRIGGLLLALREEPQHERAWERGAGGEEHVAASLAKYLDPTVLVLHDRRIPGSRANIDHVAIATSGVWVIDAKRYTGKVQISRPLFGQPRLTIAGRDQTKLIDGLDGQVKVVRGALASITPGVPVLGALCFVDAELPLIGKLTFRGYPLLHPRGLAKQINRSGEVRPAVLAQLAEILTSRLPAA